MYLDKIKAEKLSCFIVLYMSSFVLINRYYEMVKEWRFFFLMSKGDQSSKKEGTQRYTGRYAKGPKWEPRKSGTRRKREDKNLPTNQKPAKIHLQHNQVKKIMEVYIMFLQR